MIKKRNLDNSLIQWIMTQTGLGPGIGDIRYVAPAISTTSRFANVLNNNNIADGDLFATPTLAEAPMLAYQNDIMLVMPGLYNQTAELAWDKAHAHILGLGGPNTRGHYRTSSLSDKRNVMLMTATANVANVLNVTGENCQFHGIHIDNGGSHANNVGALTINNYGFYGKNLTIRGAGGTLSSAEIENGSLRIHTDADYCTFEDCTIGHNTYSQIGPRTVAASGHIIFSAPGVSGPQNGIFKNCYFPHRSETSTVGFVRIATAQGIDRDWIFDHCVWSNWSVNWVNNMANVFVGIAPQTNNIILKSCFAQGYDEWQSFDWGSMIVGDMPVAYSGGGLAIELTTNVGGS